MIFLLLLRFLKRSDRTRFLKKYSTVNRQSVKVIVDTGLNTVDRFRMEIKIKPRVSVY